MRRPRLTYANVMSTLAVFLVLAGGTAIAANLPKNSVNSKKVKDNTLRSVDLADGTGVSGADVADGSLGGADLADGSLGGADLADGSLGGNELTDGSVTGADLGGGAVGKEHLRPDSVDSSNLIDGTIKGADVGADTLTGAHIDESTLRVRNVATLFGRGPGEFVSSEIYEEKSLFERGEGLGDGSFRITQGCRSAGDVLLAGGPIGVDALSNLLESIRRNNVWSVRIRSGTISRDEFEVNVICARRLL